MERHVVTVFGGSGFIGRHLVMHLAAQGAIVRVAVRDPDAALFLKPSGDPGQIVPWPADITDAGLVRAAVKDAEAVVNLVGILYERGQRTFERIHVVGARTVAEAAAASGVRRLVHLSALGADAGSGAAYARTKSAGEEAVRAAFPAATIVRPSVVFGPEDGFFNLFASIARFSWVLPVFGCPTMPRVSFLHEGSLLEVDPFGEGGTRFQPVYVADVAKAITTILGSADTAGHTYELGGPRTYSFKEIMELVLAETGRKRLLVPVPFAIAKFEAWFLQWLPRPLLTPDQVELLKTDNVVAADAPGFADLGIAPAAAEAILPTYLRRFRTRAGRRLTPV